MKFSMESRKSPKTSTGFSLIEILIGFSIITCILVSLYSAFGAGVRIHKRCENISLLSREVGIVFDLLFADLKKVVFFQQGDGQAYSWSFSGAEDSLSFIVNSKEGLKEIRYYLKKNDYGTVKTTVVGKRSSRLDSITILNSEASASYSLLREENPMIELPDQNLINEPEILSPRITSGGVRFAFAYRKKTEDQQLKIDWQNQFDPQKILLGVRIELSFHPENANSQIKVYKRDFLFLENLHRQDPIIN